MRDKLNILNVILYQLTLFVNKTRMFMDKELFLPLAFLGVVLLIIVIILVKVLATKIKNTYIRKKYKLSNEQIYGQDKATEKLIALQNSVDELYKK